MDRPAAMARFVGLCPSGPAEPKSASDSLHRAIPTRAMPSTHSRTLPKGFSDISAMAPPRSACFPPPDNAICRARTPTRT